MSLRERLLHVRRLVPVVVLRETPLPWRWKRRIVWALSARYGLGAYAVIKQADGRVLALRSAYSGRWQLPGGGVEYHESLEQAIRRELREEIGAEPLEARMAALLNDSSGRGLHAVFRVDLSGATIRLSEEHTEWRFLEPAELSPFYRRCVVVAERTADRFIAVGLIDHTD